jgi:hypothetical protein
MSWLALRGMSYPVLHAGTLLCKADYAVTRVVCVIVVVPLSVVPLSVAVNGRQNE